MASFISYMVKKSFHQDEERWLFHLVHRNQQTVKQNEETKEWVQKKEDKTSGKRK